MSTTSENSWSSDKPPKQLNIRLPSLSRTIGLLIFALAEWAKTSYARRLMMGLSTVGFLFGMLIAVFGSGGWIDNWNDGTHVTRGSWLTVIANSLGFSIRYRAGVYGYFFAVFCSIVFVIFWAKLPEATDSTR
ncbi:hypothetical protein [Lacunimicrobium album]